MSNASDVFLSHNSEDKPLVREIARVLQQEGLTVWLDEWSLTPGHLWQEEIEAALGTTRSIAVFIGKRGVGRWEAPEMRAGISMSLLRGVPVIPVLLPGGPEPNALPMFLKAYTCVDIRMGLNPESMFRLKCGIRGLAPGADGSCPNTGELVDRPGPVQLHYFCYISAFKLEQFLAQIPDRKPSDQLPRPQKSEEGSDTAALRTMFYTPSTYGSPSKRESHSIRHVDLVQKLASLWTLLCENNRVALLDVPQPASQQIGYDLYYVRTALRVKELDGHIALLETPDRIPRIELACSLRYFSEYSDTSGPFTLHSGNYHFFQGKCTPIFDAGIVPLESNSGALIATPLFLAITSSSSLVL
jgi:hypothetical protein